MILSSSAQKSHNHWRLKLMLWTNKNYRDLVKNELLGDSLCCNNLGLAGLLLRMMQMETFSVLLPLARGIHGWPVNSPQKGQRRKALMFSMLYARINVWVNNREAGDRRRHRAHYDVIVMGKPGQYAKISVLKIFQHGQRELLEISLEVHIHHGFSYDIPRWTWRSIYSSWWLWCRNCKMLYFIVCWEFQLRQYLFYRMRLMAWWKDMRINNIISPWHLRKKVHIMTLQIHDRSMHQASNNTKSNSWLFYNN